MIRVAKANDGNTCKYIDMKVRNGFLMSMKAFSWERLPVCSRQWKVPHSSRRQNILSHGKRDKSFSGSEATQKRWLVTCVANCVIIGLVGWSLLIPGNRESILFQLFLVKELYKY